MAYNSYFPAGYQPAYYPQMQQPQMQNQPQQTNTDIKWVQGEAAAKSYPVAPNTSVTLWDQESQTIYIKSADMSGMQSIRILDYTFRDSTPQNKQVSHSADFAKQSDVDYLKEEIEALRAKFEVMEGGKK